MQNLLFLLTIKFYRVLSKLLGYFLKPQPKEKSILFLSAFYPKNAGYHWRVEKWAEELRSEGYHVTISQACDAESIKTYDSNTLRFLQKFLNRRFFQVVKARKYETVIVRRELLLFNEYGNHFLEKLLHRLCNNCILDFDDDLAAAKNQPKEVNSLFGKLAGEDGNSFRNSFAFYHKFIVASNYLKDYVINHAGVAENQVIVVPTCVDYDKHPTQQYGQLPETIQLGWIGGPHNYHLLAQILPALEAVHQRYPLSLLVIGDGAFAEKASFSVKNIQWMLSSEVQDLLQIHIGLMPLDTSVQSMGKGGFKLIQYMGLGIVSCASAVTINKDLIDHGQSGFLVQDGDWENVLLQAIESHAHWSSISKAARATIEKSYTFEANKAAYVGFLRK